jgi:hypothetical protein
MKKIFLTLFVITLMSAFCFAEGVVTPDAPKAKKENACCTTKKKKIKKNKKTNPVVPVSSTETPTTETK